MQLDHAKKLIASLADGVDPATGEPLPGESVYNRPEIIRALHCVLRELERTDAPAPAANAGKSWTDAEEALLLQQYEQGLSTQQIAVLHGRSQGAIEMRLAEIARRDQLQISMR